MFKNQENTANISFVGEKKFLLVNGHKIDFYLYDQSQANNLLVTPDINTAIKLIAFRIINFYNTTAGVICSLHAILQSYANDFRNHQFYDTTAAEIRSLPNICTNMFIPLLLSVSFYSMRKMKRNKTTGYDLCLSRIHSHSH